MFWGLSIIESHLALGRLRKGEIRKQGFLLKLLHHDSKVPYRFGTFGLIGKQD